MSRRPPSPEQADAQRATLARVRALERTQARLDLGAVLGRPDGRRVLWRVLTDLCGLYDDGYSAHGADMARLAGRRQVGLELLAACEEQHPELVLTMRHEQAAAQAAQRALALPAGGASPADEADG